jgi:hypothetical protein
MEFERVKEAFQVHGKADRYFEYEDAYNKLSERIEASCEAYPGENFGEPLRIKQNVLTYRQVLLHRAILLFEGSLYALAENNPYSMALSIRAHFETTAALGYLHNRLNSFRNGNIKAEVVDQDLCAQLLGSRDETLSEAPEAKQILSMLEYADKSISKHILGGTGRQYDILSDCYMFLCEFSHPNFHSNSVAIDLDKSVPAFKFRHGKIMRNKEFNLIEYLLLSTPLFIELFDSLVELLPEEKGSNN